MESGSAALYRSAMQKKRTDKCSKIACGTYLFQFKAKKRSVNAV